MTREEIDCISREQAKATIRDKFKDLPSRVEINTILNELPSVTPQEARWIPVSERLPEKDGKYLAYIINKKDANLQYIMTCEYYEGDLWNWYPDDDCASDNVVAWMPLPKPYKAESEDEE